MRISFLTLIILWCAAGAVHAAGPPEKAIELAMVRGVVPAQQRVIKAEKGDALRIRITSDTAGELHLHGYRLAVTLAPGEPAELAFTAYATGRYPFEWHAAVPAANTVTPRHGAAPATLEVRPK
jgi:hypothetical protein